uniref:Testis expressed 2 n=1 Tax=Sander lucioperca TaxID=283035 RepID=A0A8D0CZD3_SANLU
MNSQHPSHAKSAHPKEKQTPALSPKLHVQRSTSKDTITIHFSALGKEEEEEEEDLYRTTVSTTLANQDDSDIVTALEASEAILTALEASEEILTALEASEEMFESVPMDTADEVAVMPESSRLSPVPGHHTSRPPTHTLPLHNVEQKGSKLNSSPPKSLSFPSSDKPFLSLMKSLSSDTESRDRIPSVDAPTVRHRHLMKTLVKSLSSDTSQELSSSSSTPYRLPESRLNLQLFKQFKQSRMPSATTSSAGDSKTAPSSPLTSPENRSFFKVSDVEARYEDTKRRLSEVISEPLQLLSKMMDEKSGSSIYWPKALSASASELSNIASINDHLESNNNYCIKEEEGGDLEAESPNSSASGPAESPVPPSVDTKSPNKSLLSMSLDKCSMSALAKQEYEDFCILYSEDFENCTDTEGDGGGDRTDDTGTGSQTKVPLSGSTEPCSEDESESIEPAPSVPHYTLIFLTVLVYGYFVLPLPSYIGGMLLGIGLGFLLAIGVVWLTGPKPSGSTLRHSRHPGKLWNLNKLDIKEPEIYKGWMNEISNYDPETYHATLTHSVYVRLEGSIIRLSKPNHNVARRAIHNEPKPDVTYISQKIYDLTNSKVYLAPPSLARKRIWNKKYPICIELGKQDDFMSKAEGDRLEPGESSNTRDRGEGTGGWSSSSSRDLTLFLFGRTGREKEEWFQHFLSASQLKEDLKKASGVAGSKNGEQNRCRCPQGICLSSHSRSSSRGSLDEALASQPRSKDSSVSSATAGSAKTKPLVDYNVYMASLLPKQAVVSPAAANSALQSPQSSPGADKKLPSTSSSQEEEDDEKKEDTVAWVNAALGRVCWDFLTEPYWAELVSKKIQMKLSKIRLPYFMNELTLTELDMGSATPRILGASKPSIDYRGLWFDLEISYSGSFLMTLETKMNLIRLGKEGESVRFGEVGKDGYRPRTYCLADSDEESSSAGSSDEEDSSELSNDSAGAEGLVGGHKPSKIMRFVDKITKSKYFQKATETEFIKKKMEEVSNTPLLLTVEVQELQGMLAVNIPPPPTDRIWYGFRKPPHLELKARPKLGERVVTLAHVTDWIEKKLDQEFQKVFVMPNMDDIWLTVMHSAMDPRTAGGPLVGLAVDPEPSQPGKDSTSQP